MPISQQAQKIMEDRLRVLYQAKNAANVRLVESHKNKDVDDRAFTDMWNAMSADEQSSSAGTRLKDELAHIMQRHDQSIQKATDAIAGLSSDIARTIEYLRQHGCSVE